MADNQKSLPKWILIVSGIFALLELRVSFQLYFAPESILRLLNLWFCDIEKVHSNAYNCLCFLLIMILGDLFIGISQKENTLIIGALVMSIISVAMPL